MSFVENGLRIASGRTVPGATNWLQFNPSALHIEIDTSSGRFTGTPTYFASIGGDTNHWEVIGTDAIYAPTATKFSVYIRYVGNGPLTPVLANQMKWHINWMGMEV